MEAARREGVERLEAFTLPDYGPEDMGAREHPNAQGNRMAGEKLGDFLRGLIDG